MATSGDVMRGARWLLLVFVLSLAPHASAQIEPPSWELGWATDMDSTYLVDLDNDWDVSGELVLFVNNERSNELNLQLTYDADDSAPFEFDGPESVSIPASSNETFTITITGGSAEDVRAFSPSSRVSLTVSAEERLGEASMSTQEVEGDISVPRVYMLTPALAEPENTLFAGSWVEFQLSVRNLGNTQDAITTGQATIRSCPHLSVAGLEDVEDVIVPVTALNGEGVQFTLRMEATASHQERTCEVTVSVGSEGDASSRSTDINVAVMAPQSDNSGPDVEDDDDDDDLRVNEEPLPWVQPWELGAITMMALVWSKRR